MTDSPTAPAPQSVPRRELTQLLAALLAGSAAIHVAMVPAHASSSIVEGVLFGVAGWTQALLAGALLLRSSRRLVVAAMVVSFAILVAWVASRTVGLPWGAHAWSPEPIGLADGVCSGLEWLALVVGAVSLLVGGAARSPSAFVGVAATVVVAMATTAALVSPSGQEHIHQAGGHDEHQAAGHDETEHDHGHVTVACTDPVTTQQQAAADALVADTRAAVARYSDFGQAQADGFVPITPPNDRLVHYAIPQRLSDGKVLEPEAVESLVYVNSAAGVKYFLGSMYMQDEANPVTPMPGGCATTWHAHDNLCIAPGEGMVGVVGDDGSCPPGSRNETTMMMLHVWSVDLPAGPFAELHELTAADIVTALRNAALPSP